jgi:RND superfamily putative drug exporter
MGVSFGAMMGSHTMSIQQIGFVLSTAVMVDTFVVRLFVIPAIMVNLGEANWWPSDMATVDASARPRDLREEAGPNKDPANVHTPLL